MTHRLALAVVNGHPDDESVMAGGVMARYAAEGLRVVCITATRGEVGQIVAPDVDTPVNRARLGEIREQEERRALERLGPIELRFLGYRDSGVAGTTPNDDPRAFCRADIDEAVGRVVQILRAVQADVVICPNTFGADGHPDHVRASQVARLAFARAGDPRAYLEQLRDGDLQPWTASKLYERVTASGRREKLARALAEGGVLGLGRVSLRVARRWRPGVERDRARIAAAQQPASTRVDVGAYLEAREAALREHRTQISPGSALFALSPEERRRVDPTEDFTLVESRVPVNMPEDDLFAGLRAVDQARDGTA
ncbi:MAG: PIG-L deacetylase family protein [Candidatus Limnocylindrales bacterium]